jgi:thiamine biosynthesis protein ThiS
MIEIVVNGVPREVPDGTTVAGLIELLGVERGQVAVERNRDVVERRRHHEVTLVRGDRVEVVTFVGGG